MGNEKREASFPIVCIGASAGGLNSLQCFLSILPKEFGFAVVFIQHLSTKHKSLLPELLHNRRPDIVIYEIDEGMDILPGKLYLCPPGREVRIQGGTFHVTPPSEGHIHLPIDEFFSSLAQEAGELVIGVIFSGAGTDGARGIREIRNAGGTVFVQDPSTAEFAAMPDAAIGTGQADRVLSPENIAREILKLHGTVPTTADKGITAAQFEAFSRLIYDKTGYRFNHYKKNVVSRRIRRRMYLRGLSSIEDYIGMVAEKNSEAANLASDLMIGVTSFFRDRLAWKALGMSVIKKLAAENEDQPVRVWTPACATGEEPYSLTMFLRHEFDLAGRRREIQVFATDVNDGALEKAREGTYPGSIAADIPPDYMRKFFTCSDDGLSVIIGKEIRESVVFAKQDLLTDPPFSRLDLIICRNLLIYLEPEAQEKCIALFHYALKDGCYLFLGNAESVGRSSALFKSLGHKKCRVYQKIATKISPRLPLAVPFASERAAAAPSRTSAEYQQSVTELVQQALLEDSGPIAVAINQHCDILYNNGPTNRYLRQPRGAPTQNLLELLPDNLRSRIRGALYRASEEARPVSLRAVLITDDKKKKQVALRISKLGDNLFLVIFRQNDDKKGAAREAAEAFSPETVVVDENAVRQLESELFATRQELQSNIEQLKSLNEELQSSNEELQAANEELETSREELQSLNEELITVNAQLQSKIEEQEETNNDLNNFFSSTNIPTVFLDHQLRVKRFTPAMSMLLKLIPSDVGRPIIDMSQENLGPDLIADARSVLDHLVPIKKEIAINSTWYMRATLPYRTLDNRIEGVVITYNDVSDLKRAEEEKTRLAAIVASSDDAIISKDLNGIIQSWNAGAENIFGYAADEVLGRNISFLVPPGHVDEAPEIIRRIQEGEHIEHFESLRMRKDGTIVPVSLTYSAIRDAGGRVLGISKIAHDITERKRAEEKIIRAKEEWERTFASVPDMIAIIDNNHRVVRVNEAMAKRLGRKPEECVGMKCYEAVHGTAVPREFCPHSRSVRDGREHTQELHEERLGMDLLITTTPLLDKQGNMIGSVHVAHDITERKKAEAVQGRLAAIVESADDAIISKDLNGIITSWNIGAENIFGYTVEEAVGKNISFLVPPGHVDEVPAILERITKGEHVDHFETVRMRKDGTIIPVSLTFSVVKDASGKVIGASKIAHDITERKRAEAETQRLLNVVQEEKDRLSALVNSISDEIWFADSQKRFTLANPSALQEFGFDSADGIDVEKFAESLEVYRPDGSPRPAEEAPPLRALRGEVVKNEEEFIRTPATGEFRYRQVSSSPVRDAAGNIIGSVSVVRDITERKRADDALRESEARYHNLFNTMEEGFCIIEMIFDAEGRPADYRFLEVNAAFEKQTGLHEATGKLMRELAPAHEAHWFEIYGKIALTGEPMRFVNEAKALNRYYDVSAYRVGKPEDRHVAIIFSDISGHKRAEAALQESEARYRSLFENMLQGFAHCKMLYDEGGRPSDFMYLDVNGAFVRLTGLENVAGRRVTEVIPGIKETHPELFEIYGRVALTGQPEKFEIEFKPLESWLSVSVYSPAREHFVAIFDNITERKKYEADVLKLGEDMAMRNIELEGVNKELESFIYSISHDLRAPLRTIAGFVKILVEDYARLLDVQGQDYLARIHNGAEKMSRLIEDLLYLSKISRQEIRRNKVDMSKMASSIVWDLRETNPGRNADVNIMEGLTAFADQRLIEIILSNLLGNAWKFTAKTKKAFIEFGALEQDGKTVYYVRDNGAGFDPKYAEKMFWPFHRLHSDKEFPGTGIGLTIVERIIHSHGGRVWAEGESGKGATVYFTVAQ